MESVAFKHRKLLIKSKYEEDINRSEWREVKRYDIMNNFDHHPVTTAKYKHL